MTGTKVAQIAIGAAIALGLGAAVLWRTPSTPAEIPPAPAPTASAPAPAAVESDPPATPIPSAPPLPPPKMAPAPSDEASLMTQLRTLATTDRPRAIELAREGNARFPDSADAPERTSILIHALAGEGNTSEARRTAEDMVNHYPESSWVHDIEAFTGAHRHVNRNLRLNADGGLEYY